MKISPFTLIYQPHPGGLRSALDAPRAGMIPAASLVPDTAGRLKAVREKAPDLGGALDSINPNLSRTLIASSYAHEAAAPGEPVEDKLRHVFADLRREKKVVTVALWDLDARVGGLGRLINQLNEAQPTFTFFELQAPLPAGLVIHADNFSAWARKRLDKRVSKGAGFENNFMFDDFKKFAHVVRKNCGVDYLIGITQYMVAWTDGDDMYWNYFTASDGKIILLSAFNVREYAQQAGRPFEVAVAGMAVAEVLSALSSRVEYHPENRGCLFDQNLQRDTIVESIRQARIEPGCLELIDKKYRDAAVALTDVLRDYAPAAAEASGSPPPKAKKKSHDAEYWLGQLGKLSDKLGKQGLDHEVE